jgi:hypothetical protein
MSTPFTSVFGTWHVLSWLPVFRSGKFMGENAFEVMGRERPDLYAHVRDPLFLFNRGDVLEVFRGGRHFLLASCVVVSLESRTAALEWERQVREYLMTYTEFWLQYQHAA